MSERSVVVRLRAVTSEYQAAMGRASTATTKFRNDVADSAQRNHRNLSQVGMGATVMGGAMLAGFGVAAGAAMRFDKQMSAVGAVSNATAGQMDLLRQAALDAGQATVFSASEAAQAQAELARAGVSVADIMGGALTGSLDLAAAGQLALADAATIAAQAMNIFDLNGGQVSHVADVLAAAANKSASDVKGLGDALRQGGLVADQTGLSFEDTTAVLAAFGDRALIGSDAGTSLKTMLQRLTPQSNEAAEKMEELGLNAYDATGNFVGLEALAGEMQTSFSSLTTEQRGLAMATIFGSDAVRAANVIYELGADGIAEYSAAVNDQGAAARMAGEMTDNLAGDLEELSGAFETAMIGIGSSADGPLRAITQATTDLVNGFADLPGPVQGAVAAFLGVAGVTTTVGGGLLMVAGQVAQTSIALKGMGTSLSAVTLKMAPWMLAVAGAGVMLAVLARKNAEVKARVEGLTEAIEADIGALGENTRAQLINDLEKKGALENAESLNIATGDLVDAIMGEDEALDRVRDRLADVKNEAGYASDANWEQKNSVVAIEQALKRHTGELGDAKEAYDRKSEAMQRDETAMAKQIETTRTLGYATETFTGAVTTLGKALPGAKDEVEGLQKAQEALAEALESFTDPLGAYDDLLKRKEEAEREAATATAEATKDQEDSWEDYVRTVKVSIGEYMAELEKQLKAQDDWELNMLLLSSRVSQGTIDALTEMGAEGAPIVAELVNATDKELQRFERLFGRSTEAGAAAAAANLQQAAPVLAAIAGVAGQKTADGYARAFAKGKITLADLVEDYNAILGRLQDRKVTISINTKAYAVGPNGKVMPSGYASGGVVAGVDTTPRGTDTVPAMLTPGEFVLRRSAVDKVGVPYLRALNEGTFTPFATGGYVSGGPDAKAAAVTGAAVRLDAGSLRALADELRRAPLRAYLDGRDLTDDVTRRQADRANRLSRTD
jgi:TP901 family phage tail tape measure protein